MFKRIHKYSECDNSACEGSRHIPYRKTVCHPPDNDSKRSFTTNDETREPKPYLERNQDIVDEVDLLIACPKEQRGETIRSGTRATVRSARKKGILVVIIRPDGTVEREAARTKAGRR